MSVKLDGSSTPGGVNYNGLTRGLRTYATSETDRQGTGILGFSMTCLVNVIIGPPLWSLPNLLAPPGIEPRGRIGNSFDDDEPGLILHMFAP